MKDDAVLTFTGTNLIFCNLKIVFLIIHCAKSLRVNFYQPKTYCIRTQEKPQVAATTGADATSKNAGFNLSVAYCIICNSTLFS
jgi:hypothetical protein